jgi:hypothetical protein
MSKKMTCIALVVASLVGIVILSKTMPQARPLTGGELASIIGGRDTTPVGDAGYKCGGQDEDHVLPCQVMRWDKACGTVSPANESACASAGSCMYCNKGTVYKACEPVKGATCVPNPKPGTTTCAAMGVEGRLLTSPCKFDAVNRKCICPNVGMPGTWTDMGICDLTSCE